MIPSIVLQAGGVALIGLIFLAIFIYMVYGRYKATAPWLDPGVEADTTQPLLRLSTNK